MIDACKRASANKIQVVAPYLGYSRQDRKAKSREPITSKLIANLITKAGADRVCTLDLHQDQIQGFYDIPVDHFKGYTIFASYFKEHYDDNFVVVAPDVGATKRAKDTADLLNCPMAIIHKERPKHNEVSILHLVGEVKGKRAILIDNIVDTGETIVSAAEFLKKQGAKDIMLCATHAVLSGNAIEKIENSNISKAIFLDTINIPKKKFSKKIIQLPLDHILAEMIRRINNDESLGQLQDELRENAAVAVK